MLSQVVEKLTTLTPTKFAFAAALGIPILLILRLGYSSSFISRASAPLDPDVAEDKLNANKEDEQKSSGVMQAKVDGLTRKYDPFTLADLKPFDGSVPGNPIYVSMKGTIFDVTRKEEVYGAGKSYNIFAGKDGSKGLGMSSLKPEHAIPDFSDLSSADQKTLNDWHSFFLDRYNVVGYVVDMPDAVKDMCDSPQKLSKL